MKSKQLATLADGCWRPLLLVFLLAETLGGFAQSPPPNDHFTNRFVIGGAALTVTGSNVNATREPGEPTLGYKSVWWAWTAPTSGTYTVTTICSPLFFPRLEVFTGSLLGSLESVAANTCDGTDYSFATEVSFHAAGGTTYPIALTDSFWGSGGGLTLAIAPTTPPSVGIVIPTNGSTIYVGEPVALCADAVDDAGQVSRVEFYLDFQLVAIVTNAPFCLEHVFTNGPVGIRFRARAIDDWGVGVSSEEVIFLVTYPPPTNDAFAQRFPIAGASLSTTGWNRFATREPGELTLGDKSVWWSWTAPTSGVYTVTAVAPEGDFSPFLGAYGGNALSNLIVVAENSYYDNYVARVVLNATGGATYALAVTTVGGIGGEISLRIAPTTPPSVSILTPTNGARVYVGEPVRLSAQASDNDGTVTSVTFLFDGSVVSFTNAPYRLDLTFTNGDVGIWFQAQATDNWGVTSISTPVLFEVTYPPPDNDNFASRIQMAGASVLATGDNRYATREPGDPTAGEKSVWWAWTAPTSGVYTVTAVGLGGFYPFLGVYTGSALTNLTLLASDTFGGSDSTYAARVMINATGGTIYPVAVSTVAGIGGYLNLCITAPLPAGEPAKFDSITPLSDGSSRLVFSTGASSFWGLETSTNLSAWEGTFVKYLSSGRYEINDFQDGVVPRRFYRLRAEP